MSGESPEQGRLKRKHGAYNIERDKTHMEQVVRWAEFVKTHPREVWIKQTGPFIDSQIIMANRFYERLSRTSGGKDKIMKLKDLKNRTQ
ncbi:MAG: hypothetical protein M8349_07325 [ANME-2 cluster archaeon]|nr:hypothetical protein [ANME-2 cluster archaeon]MDF1557220.1 hypothetical protein [ANME-2 cluster archaeon]